MVLRGGKPLCDIDKLFGKLSLFPGEQPLERFSKFSTYPKQNCCSDLHLSVLHGGEGVNSDLLQCVEQTPLGSCSDPRNSRIRRPRPASSQPRHTGS